MSSLSKAVLKQYAAAVHIAIAGMCSVGCSSFLGVMADMAKSDRDHYDDLSCRYGEEAPPDVYPRDGCVNAKTRADNYDEFRRYQVEREIYLESAREE